MWCFNQAKPKDQAELFLPQLIRQIAHSSPAFTSDGKEMYWSTVAEAGKPRTIYFSEFQNNEWSDPKVASFSGSYHDDHPFITADSQTLYFASIRPSELDRESKMRMWKVERMDEGWGKEVEVGKPIGFWTPSMTKAGTMYFLDNMDNPDEGDSNNRFGIFRSERINGKYETAQLLPDHINLKGSMNWCPFISPDESFLLFSSDRPGSSGSGDLFVSFRAADGGWTEAINMGEAINTENQERFPGLSPDGKILFFTRSCATPNYHDLYWMDAGIIDQIKAGLKMDQAMQSKP